MSWDDRYFEAAPRRSSRVMIAFAAIVMLLMGLLFGIGGLASHSKGTLSALGAGAMCACGLGLVLYGFDLLVRVFRPVAPGETFEGPVGTLRMVGLGAMSSLFVALGAFGAVRKDVVVGGMLIAVGLLGLVGVLYARTRRDA